MKHCPQCGREWADQFQFCPHDAAGLQDAPADPLVGQVLANKYEILERLGQGPHGIVYRARHRIADQPCAIKLLNSDLTRDQVQLHNLRAAVQIGLQLRSPYTLRLYDFDHAEGFGYFIVEELVDGKSLRAALREHGRFSAALCAKLLRQTGESLIEAHTLGFFHNHLSAANILLAGTFPEVTAKVSDYGLGQTSPILTAAASREFDADIASLGSLLYQMLTGESPFASQDGGASNPRSPQELQAEMQRADAPPHLVKLTLRLLGAGNQERVWSVADALSALDKPPSPDSEAAAVRASTGTTSHSVSVAPANPALFEESPMPEESQVMWEAQPRLSLPRVGLALLLVAALAVGLSWLLRGGAPAKQRAAAPVETSLPPTQSQDDLPRFDKEIVQRENEGEAGQHAHVMVRVEGLPLYILRDKASYPSPAERADAVVGALESAAKNLRGEANVHFDLEERGKDDVIVQKGAAGALDLTIVAVTHGDLHGYQARSRNKKITHEELAEWWLARTRDYMGAFVLGNAPYQTKSHEDGAALAQLYWQVRARSKNKQETPLVLLRQALSELDPKLKEDLQNGIFQYPVKVSPAPEPSSP